MKRILFIDRDGTLVEEPHDEQVDSLDKIRFKPGVFRWLGFLREKTDFRHSRAKASSSTTYSSTLISLKTTRRPVSHRQDW